MKKIKTWLIHRLGGLTTTDNDMINKAACHAGYLFALHDAKEFAERMNGTPADEWCKRMYGYFLEKIKSQKI